jgi:hypothetical protein
LRAAPELDISEAEERKKLRLDYIFFAKLLWIKKNKVKCKREEKKNQDDNKHESDEKKSRGKHFRG